MLKKRLEETEKAMERIVAQVNMAFYRVVSVGQARWFFMFYSLQMGAVTSRLAPHIISQAMDDVNRQVLQ